MTTISVVALLMLARTPVGMDMAAAVRGVLSFFAGVVALVALTITVALGLLSADRVVLPALGRIRTQFAHRAAAMVGVGFLATHVLMKIVEGRAAPAAAVVPMATAGPGLYIGFGAIASDLMLLVFATGIARASFAANRRPWLWRLLHGSAYLAWPMSILHGLTAGRQPAEWVTWSYVVCLTAVGAALLIRMISALQPRNVVVHIEAPVELPVAADVAPPLSIVGRIPRQVREDPPELHRIGGVG
ncbi:hypothetical protein [Streptosporangium subroseum]|uniref:hypothetical protein n=1 Tax=Streptosporangium subroseum TaxID=106412 RepID=UPI003091E8B4|nr:hypothetical protein OHB15_39815 [Streptosporangium subroseum]